MLKIISIQQNSNMYEKLINCLKESECLTDDVHLVLANAERIFAPEKGVSTISIPGLFIPDAEILVFPNLNRASSNNYIDKHSCMIKELKTLVKDNPKLEKWFEDFVKPGLAGFALVMPMYKRDYYIYLSPSFIFSPNSSINDRLNPDRSLRMPLEIEEKVQKLLTHN